MLRSDFDKNLYRSLVESATLRYEFYKGTTDELVSYRANTVTGGRFGPCGTTIAWYQTAANDRVDFTVAQAQVVQASQSFALEWFGVPGQIDYYPFTSSMGFGGIECRWRGDIGVLYVSTYTAAGALARQYSSPAYTQGYWGRPTHFLYSSSNGCATAALWVDGVPGALGVAGAGVAADGGVSPHYVSGIGGGLEASILVRVYPRAMEQQHANALWGSASVLAGRI